MITIREMEEIVYRVSKGLSIDDRIHDDVLQEGLIAAWRRQQAESDAIGNHLGQTAKLRMIDVLNGRREFGNPSTKRRYEPKSLTQYVVEGSADKQTERVDVFQQAEDRADLAPALAVLGARDRAIVDSLYSQGMTQRDTAVLFGITREHLNRHLHSSVFPVMRAAMQSRKGESA